MAQMQWLGRRTSSSVQIERFPLFFQFENCVQITMRKKYATTNEMMHRFSSQFLETLDYGIIHFRAAKTFCEMMELDNYLWLVTANDD